MPVGYRAHDVTGSGIALGAAPDGLRGPKASASLHEWKEMPDRLMPGIWHRLSYKTEERPRLCEKAGEQGIDFSGPVLSCGSARSVGDAPIFRR